MLAVQECYISVCKEKDMLEERLQGKEKEEASINEVCTVPGCGHCLKQVYLLLLGHCECSVLLVFAALHQCTLVEIMSAANVE